MGLYAFEMIPVSLAICISIAIELFCVVSDGGERVSVWGGVEALVATDGLEEVQVVGRSDQLEIVQIENLTDDFMDGRIWRYVELVGMGIFAPDGFEGLYQNDTLGL